MLVIGIQGSSPGAGKDTAYEIIQRWAERKGLTTQRIAFGDQLKIRALRTLGFEGTDQSVLAEANRLKNVAEIRSGYWDQSEIDHLIDTSYCTMRRYIQNYGQIIKESDEDYWVEAVDEPHNPDIAVYTDVRFYNEWCYVESKSYDSKHIYIDASKRVPLNENVSVEGNSLGIDWTIDNNSTIENFEKELITMLEEYIG